MGMEPVTRKQRAPGLGLANARQLLLHAQQCGISDEALLTESGLSRTQIDLGLADVSIEQELAMIKSLCRLGGEPFTMGLETGLRYQLTGMGMLGLCLISSRDVRAAMEMARRYLASAEHLTEVGMKLSRDELVVSFSCRMPLPADMERFVIGREIGIAAAIQGEILRGQPRNVRALTLTYPRLPVMDRIEELFGCKVTELAADNSICSDASCLQLAMPMQNPVAAVACEELCTGQPAVNSEETISHRVQRLVARMLPDVPDMASVAAGLCMSSRTLGRRLEEEGWRWRDLVSECRLNRAEELLRCGESIKSAALKAGFSSASSFSHAFNRARGISPRRYAGRES